ncbi:MAG TPA: hypothetical protein PLI90_04815 [Rhodocyclaceae bacterium]|nr:hypothetical protein [Rhodocyclaceae bacterium]
MSLFENYVRETQQIELEIERKGVALGLDWDNELQIREIARKALAGPQKEVSVAFHNLSWNDRAMLELFALSQLMLTVMQESATEDMQTHGGKAWKSLGRALWIEAAALGVVDADKLRERLSLHVEHQPG